MKEKAWIGRGNGSTQLITLAKTDTLFGFYFRGMGAQDKPDARSSIDARTSTG